MKHTIECIERNKRWDKKVAEYEKKYPNHCEFCDGWGGKWSYYDPSPSGVGLSSGYMTDFDPCPDCLEQGLCPMCKDVLMESNGVGDLFCERCQKSDFEGIPQSPECWCWEQEGWYA